MSAGFDEKNLPLQLNNNNNNLQAEINAQMELMLDGCPMACIMFNDEFKAVDCNNVAVSIGSAKSKQELLVTYTDYYPKFQPDGEESIPKMERLLKAAAVLGKLRSDWMYHLLDGSDVPCKITISRLKWGNSFCLIMYAEDLRELKEEMRLVEEAENRSKLMLDNTLMITSIWDKDGKMIDCSNYAVDVFGLESKSEYIEHFYDLNPEYQPNGMTTAESADYHIKKAFDEGYDKFDWMYLTKSGEDLPVETTLMRVWWNNDYHLLAHSIDKREIEDANAKIKSHSELLKVCNDIASNMMSAGPHNFERIINEQFLMLGRAVKVNRVYIWRIYQNYDKDYCEQIFESNENVEAQQGKDFTIEFDFDDAPFTKENMMAGKSINGPITIFPSGEYEVYEVQGIKSVLLIPLKLNDKIWGFIGFDDCQKENIFSKEVENLLGSCGAMFLSAIEKNNATRNLITTRNELILQDRLLRAVNESARILLSNNEKNDIAMQRVLEIIGGCVGALSVAIWQNFVDIETGEHMSKRLSAWRYNNHIELLPQKTVRFLRELSVWDDWTEKNEVLKIQITQEHNDIAEWLTVPEAPLFMLIPINSDSDFWGFASYAFDDKYHMLTDKEMDILQSANLMFANSVTREETNHKLIEATGAALESVKSKNEFLARMSHEIRTPINAIVGMTEIAKNTTDLTRIKDCLNTVTVSSKQLLSIIDDVLDMAKIDLGKMKINNLPFSFENMISSVIDMLRERMAEKNLGFNYDIDEYFDKYMIGDEKKIMQIIVNLLTNAIKFTQNGGEITLEIRCINMNKDCKVLKVSVIDNGVGISEKALPIIFNAFEQGDGSITRKYGGTGLGLSISQNIISLMNGVIYAESKLGNGSKFTFEIPIEFEDSYDVADKITEQHKALRIMIICSNAGICCNFIDTITRLGLCCDVIKCADDAFDKITEMRKENIFYDIIYTGSLDTANHIRHLSQNTKIVIVSCTRNYKVGNISNFSCLQYPIMPYAIFKTIDTYCQSSIDNVTFLAYDWSDKHLLLVEDIEINQCIIMALLEETNIEIDVADNGQIAVDMYNKTPERYDFVMMDMQMPVMDGLTATRKIREMNYPNAKTIPIYAMTANAFKEDAEQCIAAGMNGHLAKPIDIHKLYTTLSSVLGTKLMK